MTRFIGRDNVQKRLASLDGRRGRTVYAGGIARIETDADAIVVRPPFGLDHTRDYDFVQLAPLFEALSANYVVGALLVRLGGYAIGVFEGERLVASKVGSRFVKGRHKKGGSSASRFARRRDNQAEALKEEAAATAVDVLQPWRDRVEFVALGGDRRAVADVLKARPELDWLAERAVARFFTVAEPRLQVLEKLPYDLYAAELSDVTGQAEDRSKSRNPDSGRN